jgi:hypothetical protein
MPRFQRSTLHGEASFFVFALLATLLSSACLFSPLAAAQESSKRLTNQDIIAMSSLGLSDDVIIVKIRSVSGSDGLNFDTSVDGLKSLKEAKVSDAVVKAMINPALPPTVVVTGAPMTPDPNLPPPEVGVYWRDGPTFALVQGKTLTQEKVGGRAASIFTNGIRSAHWDAVVEGPTSANLVKDRRPVFYFYVPDGDTAADYTLLSLEKKTDHREFQVGSLSGDQEGKAGFFSRRTRRHPRLQNHFGFRSQARGIRLLPRYRSSVQYVGRRPGRFPLRRKCYRQDLRFFHPAITRHAVPQGSSCSSGLPACLRQARGLSSPQRDFARAGETLTPPIQGVSYRNHVSVIFPLLQCRLVFRESGRARQS